MRKTIHQHTARGFTLLEVALTIGIITLLLSMMVGVGSSFGSETALRTAANSVSACVHKVRREALARRASIRVTVESGGLSLSSEPADGGNKGSAAHDPARPSVAFEPGVSLLIWNSERRRWVTPEGVNWTIGVDGTVRSTPFRLVCGRSTMDFEVNPLTGEIVEVGFEI